MVAAGRLGRKSGRGYYEYAEDGSYRADDPEPPAPGGARRALALLGDGPLADGLRERARAAGYELREGGPAELVVDAGSAPAPARPRAARRWSSCAPAGASPPAASPAPSASTCCRRSRRRSWSSSPACPTTQSFACDAAEGFFAASAS